MSIPHLTWRKTRRRENPLPAKQQFSAQKNGGASRTGGCGGHKRQSGDQHSQRPGQNEDKPPPGAPGKPFVKYQIRKGHRDKDAQLVNGDHQAGQSVLKGPVVAQPGGAGGDAGQTDRVKSSASLCCRSPVSCFSCIFSNSATQQLNPVMALSKL